MTWGDLRQRTLVVGTSAIVAAVGLPPPATLCAGPVPALTTGITPGAPLGLRPGASPRAASDFSGYWPMDNVHIVAVRPGANELFVSGHETSFVLVVDVNSADHPVVAGIPLPGVRPLHASITFSPDGRRAFIPSALQCNFEVDCGGWGEENRILVIDAAKREIEVAVSMPYPLTPLEGAVPSPDGKTLYFVAADFPENKLGIGRLDVEAREVQAFAAIDGANSVAISPDGSRLYVTQGCNLFGGTPPAWCQAPNRLAIVDAQTLSTLSSVAVGDGPRAVAVTPDGRKAYVTNQWSNTTSVVDLSSLEVKTLSVGADRSAVAITPDGSKAYVTLPGTYVAFQFDNRVAVIDVARDELLSTIQVHIEPLGIAMDPDGRRAYVSDGNANGPNPAEVHVLDVKTDAYLRSIMLRPAAQVMPTAIDITPDGKTLLVVSQGVEHGVSRTRLVAVDLATRNIRPTLAARPRGVTVSYDGTKVLVFCEQELLVLDSVSLQRVMSVDLRAMFPTYPAFFTDAFRVVVNRAGDTAYLVGLSTEVVVVNLTRGEVVARIPFAAQPVQGVRGLALTPDDQRLFVSDIFSNSVSVIDTSMNAVVAKVPLNGAPSEVKVSPDGQRVYCLETSGMTLASVLDRYTYAVIRTLPMPVSMPLDLELSPDERYLYAPDVDPNFLVVYDVTAGKIAKVVPTGVDPFNTVSSPDRKLIYITNFTSDSISVFDTQTMEMLDPIRLPPLGDSLFTVSPCRVVDTRDAGLGGPNPLAAGVSTAFSIAGRCGIPSTAIAVSANLTAVGAAARGYLTVYPGDAAGPPLVSNINFTPGVTRANNAIVLLATNGGTINVMNGSAGTVHFVLDVNGYFQ